MQVVAIEPGHAQCFGRDELRRVRTALVGDVTEGEWLLIFLDSAQERISEQRAQEINATLDMLAAALQGQDVNAPAGQDAFELPSRMSREELLALSGGTPSSV
jgi:hydrogenase expression/formation protein HypC